MSEVPLYSVLLFAKVSPKQILLSATERRGKNLKSFEEFRLKAKAKIWRWLSYKGNICSTAVAIDTGICRQRAAGGLCGLFQCYVVSFGAVWSVSVQCGQVLCYVVNFIADHSSAFYIHLKAPDS